MKINDILTEDQKLELHYLQEGPILNKFGQGVGKVAGTAAKAVGSVAGGVAGLGSAFMKGFRGGKSTVAAAGDEDEGDTAAPSTGSGKPASSSGASSGSATAPAAAPAAAPKTAAAPKSDFGKLTTAAAGGAAPDGRIEPTLAEPKSDSAYAQAQKAVDGLPPEQKKEIITMLQADPKVKAAMEKPVSKKPAAKPAPAAPTGNYDGNTGAPLSDKAKADAAFDASPEGKALQAKVDAMGTAPATPKKRAAPKKKAQPTQAEIDADRERLMGPTSDSVVRKGPSLVENFSLYRRN